MKKLITTPCTTKRITTKRNTVNRNTSTRRRTTRINTANRSTSKRRTTRINTANRNTTKRNKIKKKYLTYGGMFGSNPNPQWGHYPEAQEEVQRRKLNTIYLKDGSVSVGRDLDNTPESRLRTHATFHPRKETKRGVMPPRLHLATPRAPPGRNRHMEVREDAVKGLVLDGVEDTRGTSHTVQLDGNERETLAKLGRSDSLGSAASAVRGIATKIKKNKHRSRGAMPAIPEQGRRPWNQAGVDIRGRPIDRRGRLIDEKGWWIDENGRWIDEEGHWINIKGQRINRFGKRI